MYTYRSTAASMSARTVSRAPTSSQETSAASQVVEARVRARIVHRDGGNVVVPELVNNEA